MVPPILNSRALRASANVEGRLVIIRAHPVLVEAPARLEAARTGRQEACPAGPAGPRFTRSACIPENDPAWK